MLDLPTHVFVQWLSPFLVRAMETAQSMLEEKFLCPQQLLLMFPRLQLPT